MMLVQWENYGDVNPIEHGGIFIKADGKDFPGCYYVVAFNKMPDEDKWLLSDMYVDLNDDWYEWDAVSSYADVHEDEEDEYKVIALTQYYGSLNFGHDELIEDEGTLKEELLKFGIEVE